MNEELIKILDKLLQPYTPYGETQHDNESLDNLEIINDILLHLITICCTNTKYISRPEYSMQQIAKKSYEILSELSEIMLYSIKSYKELIYKDTFQTPKFHQIGVLPHIYYVNQHDHIVSPYSLDYTKEWYTKHYNEVETIEEIMLFLPSNDNKQKPKYQQSDPIVQFWDKATPQEEKLLGTNIMLQPNTNELGTIRNIYGDVYTKRSFYEVINNFIHIDEPIMLCSIDF